MQGGVLDDPRAQVAVPDARSVAVPDAHSAAASFVAAAPPAAASPTADHDPATETATRRRPREEASDESDDERPATRQRSGRRHTRAGWRCRKNSRSCWRRRRSRRSCRTTRELCSTSCSPSWWCPATPTWATLCSLRCRKPIRRLLGRLRRRRQVLPCKSFLPLPSFFHPTLLFMNLLLPLLPLLL